MKIRAPYSLNWNKTRKVWIARYKNLDNGNWDSWWLPSSLREYDKLEAQQRLIDAYEAYKRTRIPPGKTKGTSKTKKTLALLSQVWLDIRKANVMGTKNNTYLALVTSVRCWILDNPEFPHLSIQDLDVETELKPFVVIEWIRSLQCSTSSRIKHISILRTMLTDLIEHEYLNVSNPLNKKSVKELDQAMRRAYSSNKETIRMKPETVAKLLTSVNTKVKDYRRIRYLLAIATGLRDHEIQGLVWDDLRLEDPIPFISLERQLDKIGKRPFATYYQLADKGLSREQITKYPYAVMSKPKYDSKRLIPLHPLAVAAMQWWLKVGWSLYVGRPPTKEDPVFARGNDSLRKGQEPGTFYFPESSEILADDLERLLIDDPDVTFHSTRRTFVSMLADQSVDPGIRTYLMGHGAKSVSESNYITREPATLRAAILKLPLPEYLQLERLQIRPLVSAANTPDQK